MNLPAVLFAIRWLVRDTFRQARASGVTAATLIATAVCTLLCLSIAVSGDTPELPVAPGEAKAFLPKVEADRFPDKDKTGIDIPGGQMTLLFGAFPVDLKRPRADSVRFVEVLLAGGAADTVGVLLALLWTAGFLPTFFDPATATVLFAKPVPRWAILIGKFGGVLLLVAVQGLLFVTAVWAALGIRTGVWDGHVFAAVPLLVIHFGCFYAVSALLAVTTRSTVVCVVGTVGVWAACWAVNFVRHTALNDGNGGGVVLEAAYWLLPKPADLGMLLVNALNAGVYFGQSPALKAVAGQIGLMPELSLLSSCLLPIAALTIAGWRLMRTEY
jgi:ABC-type transport system involved in multi-copper enzyme maturation permease subunit